MEVMIIKNVLNDLSHDELAALGFKHKNGGYYRIINDVFQSFMLKIYRVEETTVDKGGLVATIEFKCSPLFTNNIDAAILSGRYSLEYLREDPPRAYYFNCYINGKPITPDEEGCAKQIWHDMTKYLIAFFDRANTSKNVFHEIYKYETYYVNYTCKCNTDRTNAKIIILRNNDLYYSALKNRNCEFALEVERFNLSLANNEIIRISEQNWGTDKKEVVIRNCQKKALLSKRIINDIEHNDWKMVDEILNENAHRNIEKLKSLKMLPQNFTL